MRKGDRAMTRQEKNERILAALPEMYPDARPALHFDNAWQLLVAVMLSAQCTDVKVNLVTPALFSAYPDAAAMAKAAPEVANRKGSSVGPRLPAGTSPRLKKLVRNHWRAPVSVRFFGPGMWFGAP